MTYRHFKRILDVVIGGALLLVTLPFLALAFLAVRITMGRPVMFVQLRPGKNEELFPMRKFRTMNFERDSSGRFLSDNERLTVVGRLLRKTSIDELPQLLNVVRGEMSLIGPRPLFKDYLPHYTPEQRRRHTVRPGITGWAQVNGRNNLTFSQRIALDLYYIDNLSFVLDLKILVLTALRVLLQKDIRSDQDIAEIDDIGLAKDLNDESFVPLGMVENDEGKSVP